MISLTAKTSEVVENHGGVALVPKAMETSPKLRHHMTVFLPKESKVKLA